MNQFSVLISHYRPDVVSGAERAVADMVTLLSEKISATMFVPSFGKLARYFQERDLPTWIKTISTPRKIIPGLHTIQSVFLSAELRKRKFDGLVCNTFSATSRVSTASRMAKLPYAIYVREYVRDCGLHRRVLQRADAIFAVSNDVARHIEPMANRKPVQVIYDNILAAPILERITNYQDMGKRELPFDRQTRVVGWVGRITRYKQPEVFIRAIPLVVEQLPDIRFVIIGAAKPNEKVVEVGLKRLVEVMGISQHVVFMGQREDSVELMSEMAVLCLTSTREPFARVILEAQLVGCPVIAPLSGGAPEAVKDGSTGLLFDSCGTDAHFYLADRIVRLLREQSFAKKLAGKAKEEVMAGYATRQPVRVFEDRLSELFADKKPKYG